MRIAYITAGAGGTICGNCLRDNALAAALKNLGHDVLLLPVYTPIRTDEPDVSERSVYLGGVNIYLAQKSSLFSRLPRFLRAPLDHPGFLRWVSKFAVKTLPEDLGALTLATAKGEDGPLRQEIATLTDYLKDYRPDVVHLTNSMLAGLAPPLRRELSVPIFCALQGEDYYLEHLPAPFPEQTFAELRRQARAIDVMVAPCKAQAHALGPRLGKDVESIPVILPGINTADFSPPAARAERPFTVGFLGRIAPEKAPHLLLDAVPTSGVARFAGWVSPEYAEYAAGIEAKAEMLRDVDRRTKVEFLQGLDALSVPTLYGASKGPYVMEAWASGVPVVQPRIGVFPELIEAAGGGGLLFDAGDVEQLGTALEWLKTYPDKAREMGMTGYRAAHSIFTADRMARDTLALYSKTLS